MKTTNQAMHPLHDLSADDAIDMLIADHKRVANLFAEFKRLTDEGHDEKKVSIVAQICRELSIHTQLEEEIFYPAVRISIDDEDQMDEAVVEHAGAKQLIAQLMTADYKDELYDAKVTVLGEQIDHHVDEEEGSMFPKARHSGLDALALGAAMSKRKKELQSGAPAKTASLESATDESESEDVGGAANVSRVKTRKKLPKRKPAPASKKRRR